MLKKLLTKSLLVAVGLCVGATNVRAQVVEWAMASNGTYTGGMELSSNTGIVSVKLGNGTWEYNGTWGVRETSVGNNITKTDNIPTAGNYIVIKPVKDIAMSLYTRSSTNHNFVMVEESAPTTNIINIRDRYYVTYDLGTLSAPLKAGKTYYAYSTGGADLGYRSFTVTTIENYTIHYVDDSATPVTIKNDVVYAGLYGAQVTASETDMAQVTYNSNSYAYKSGNETITLGTGTNEITLVYENVSSANYTIKYVDGDNNSIAEDVVMESYVGAEVTASGANLPTYITYNNVKYEYASGNTVLTVTNTEANNVITLVYNEAPTYSYTVKSSLGTTITSGSAYKDETIYYHYPQVLKSGSTLYTTSTDNTGVDDNGYKSKFVLDSNNKEVTKTYTAGITNLLFLAEGEDIFTRGTGVSADTRLSMGAGGYASAKTDIITLPAGTYTIAGVNRGEGSGHSNHTFYMGGDEIVTTVAHGYNDNFSKEFTLTESTTISMQGGGNTRLLDYVYIYGTPTKVTASISKYGYRTFSSAYDLDFTNVEGLTAYIATSSDDSYVKLTEIEKVPAQTGLVLKGAKGTYDIPVTDSYTSSDWPSGKTNYLKQCLAETTVEASLTGTNYVLSVQNETVVFAPIDNEFSPRVEAGGAYLYIPTGVGGAKLRLVFGDEDATAINGIESENASENGAIYNLAGQRVGKDYKGLVIKNGKKFMNK